MNTSGDKVNWFKIKTLRYDKKYPNQLLYCYDYFREYSKIDIKLVKRRSTGRCTDIVVKDSSELTKDYSSMSPISKLKYNDLQKLCKTNVIPSQYHHWYTLLPCAARILDLNHRPSIESDFHETSEQINVCKASTILGTLMF